MLSMLDHSLDSKRCVEKLRKSSGVKFNCPRFNFLNPSQTLVGKHFEVDLYHGQLHSMAHILKIRSVV